MKKHCTFFVFHTLRPSLSVVTGGGMKLGAEHLGKIVVVTNAATRGNLSYGQRGALEQTRRIGKSALFDVFGRGGGEVFPEDAVDLAVREAKMRGKLGDTQGRGDILLYVLLECGIDRTDAVFHQIF